MYNIIKQLTSTRLLLRNDEGDSLVASYSEAFVKYGNKPEVLIFKSNSEGTISDWVEVYGQKHQNDMSAVDAIVETVRAFNKADVDDY